MPVGPLTWLQPLRMVCMCACWAPHMPPAFARVLQLCMRAPHMPQSLRAWPAVAPVEPLTRPSQNSPPAPQVFYKPSDTIAPPHQVPNRPLTYHPGVTHPHPSSVPAGCHNRGSPWCRTAGTQAGRCRTAQHGRAWEGGSRLGNGAREVHKLFKWCVTW